MLAGQIIDFILVPKNTYDPNDVTFVSSNAKLSNDVHPLNAPSSIREIFFMLLIFIEARVEQLIKHYAGMYVMFPSIDTSYNFMHELNIFT